MHLLHYIKVYVFTDMFVPTPLLIFTLIKEIDVSEQRPVDRGYLLYMRDNSYPVI